MSSWIDQTPGWQQLFADTLARRMKDWEARDAAFAPWTRAAGFHIFS